MELGDSLVDIVVPLDFLLNNLEVLKDLMNLFNPLVHLVQKMK
jgi:hypothetical protein